VWRRRLSSLFQPHALSFLFFVLFTHFLYSFTRRTHPSLFAHIAIFIWPAYTDGKGYRCQIFSSISHYQALLLLF